MNNLLSKKMHDRLLEIKEFYEAEHAYRPTYSDLADHLNTTIATAQSIFYRLEKAGALKRKRNGSVAITYEGLNDK